jgi:hypothetical protein
MMLSSDVADLVRGEAMNDPIGDGEDAFTFADGQLQPGIGHPADDDCEIVVRGTQDQWDQVLAEYPVPFYQCLQTASVRHGLYLNNTNELFAYLPALNRLTTLLRLANNKKAVN